MWSIATWNRPTSRQSSWDLITRLVMHSLQIKHFCNLRRAVPHTIFQQIEQSERLNYFRGEL